MKNFPRLSAKQTTTATPPTAAPPTSPTPPKAAAGTKNQRNCLKNDEQ